MTRSAIRCLLVCLVALVAQPLWAQGLPANLAFVPPDAVGFIHVPRCRCLEERAF